MIADFCSVEAAFVLFLFSGRYKFLPEFRWFPADLTMAFLGLTLGLVGWAMINGRLKPPPLTLPVIALVLFSEFVAASYFWSSTSDLNSDKAQRYLILTATAFLLAYVLSCNPDRRQRIGRLVAWFSAAFAGYYVFYRYVMGIDLVAVDDFGTAAADEASNNYLEFGSHAAILFIVCLVSVVVWPWRRLWLALLGLAASLMALLSIGGRGPFVTAVLAIPLVAVGLTFQPSRAGPAFSRLGTILLILGLTAGIATVTTDLADKAEFRTLERLRLQLSNEDTSSLDERSQGRNLALRLWLESPTLGWGIGEYRVHDSYLHYPHNLLLEILAELGIVGASLFAAFVFPAVVACLRIARGTDPPIGDMVFALLFLTELALRMTVQGYLADDRIFFCFVAIVLASTVNPARTQPS